MHRDISVCRTGAELAELGVRHHSRRQGHEPQAETQTIRFLLAIVGDETSKCTQTAEKLPPGAQRQVFLAMAASWMSLAAKIESSEALLNTPTNDPSEPYRFGSRIDTQQCD
jgi:phytoene/squalene synthetase